MPNRQFPYAQLDPASDAPVVELRIGRRRALRIGKLARRKYLTQWKVLSYTGVITAP
jgi:hypothetical protein